MRKAMKEQILEMLGTLMKAHDSVRKLARDGKTDAARNLLADCQDVALAVGNAIEQSEGSLDPFMEYLEGYCQELFRISEVIGAEGTGPQKLDVASLNRQIHGFQKAVKSRIKVVLKFAFFPYKASMWTSLESIWEAAAADEECEAQVVVVPYYTLDPYGRKTQLVYEGDMFPPNVPVIHYSRYDVKRELPDAIFIHNPYDEGNNVTRVPEEYYSYNLKPYTTKLVFSPYAMMGYYSPQSGALMTDTGGMQNADYILVQSERVKQIYINEGIRPEKLIALGSPKVDAIVRLKDKKPDVPEEWRRKLEGRKVFLLNTHLSYFIDGYLYEQKYPDRGNYALQVHERLFSSFLNQRGKALIWRPHPLLKSMLESRGLYSIVNAIEDFERDIQESDNSVMDNNGSYDLSFQLSDALVTTYSSIVSEYMITGKPVYIYQARLNLQNVKASPVDYSNIYFFAPGKNHFHEFIEMVLAGEDYLYKERMFDMDRAFSNLEGTIGLNACNELKRLLLK